MFQLGSDSEMIRLSFIVAVYNVEKYIGHCLSSLFNQDIPESEYEVICVNDGSSDNSEQIILEFQNKYRNLTIFSHSHNRGLGTTRNTGLAAARGRFVWFIDSDDFIKENCLGKVLEICESNDLDIFHMSVLNQEGDNYIVLNDSTVMTGVQEFVIDGIDYWFTWDRVYNRDFLYNNSLFFIGLRNSDILHTLKALGVAKRVMDSSACYYHYRLDNEESAMRKWTRSADSIVSFSLVMGMELHKCALQLPPSMTPKVLEHSRKQIQQCFKPVYKLPVFEKKRFYNIVNENKSLKKACAKFGGLRTKIVLYCPTLVFILGSKPLYIPNRFLIRFLNKF